MELFNKVQQDYNKNIYNLKATKLRQNIAIMSCFIPVIYTLLDYFAGFYDNVGLYVILLFSFVISILFNKRKFYHVANFFLLTPAAVVIFLFASSDVNHQTASHVFFIVLAIVSITLTGYENQHLGIAGAFIIYGLFVLTSVVDLEFIPTPDKVNNIIPTQLYYIINVSTAIIISVLIILFFINKNHSIEQSLVYKNNRLNDLNNKLDRLFYIVSHDLKSPLNSIKGLISVAESGHDDNKRECLEMINNRVLTLEKFIADVTNISRRNNSKPQLEKIDLATLVDNIYVLNYHHEKSNFINFRKEIDGEIVLKSDSLRLQIILGNLISNAINYHDMSRVDAFINVKNYRAEDKHLIEVIDNGMGISKKHVQDIFDMFYKVGECNNLTGSTGLGLYIVKETLNEIDGTIEVESYEDIGTTFRISLPIEEKQEEKFKSSIFKLKKEELELEVATI